MNSLLVGAAALSDVIIHKRINDLPDLKEVDLRSILERIRVLEEGLLYWKNDIENGLNGGTAIGDDNRLDNGEPNPVYRNIPVYKCEMDYDFVGETMHIWPSVNYTDNIHPSAASFEQAIGRTSGIEVPIVTGQGKNFVRPNTHYGSSNYQEFRIFYGLGLILNSPGQWSGGVPYRPAWRARALGSGDGTWGFMYNNSLLALGACDARRPFGTPNHWHLGPKRYSCLPLRKIKTTKQCLKFTGVNTIKVPVKMGQEGMLVIGDIHCSVLNCVLRHDVGLEMPLNLLLERGKNYSYIRIPSPDSFWLSFGYENPYLLVKLQVSNNIPIVYQYDF